MGEYLLRTAGGRVVNYYTASVSRPYQAGLKNLKESLHINLMTIVFLEINQLHSLGYRQMIAKEKIYERLSLRVQLSYNIK